MTEQEFYNTVFLPYVRQYETDKQAAGKLLIDESYLCHILAGRRPITSTIATRLGYTLYETTVREFVKVVIDADKDRRKLEQK